MMKKAGIIAVAAITIFVFTACTPRAEPEENFTFRIVDAGRGMEITGYTGGAINLNIPSRIQGLPVTSIGVGAFQGAQITSVSIPGSVTRIGNNAFRDSHLTGITLPRSVTEIGFGAFAGTHITNPPMPTFAFATVWIDAGTFTMGSNGNEWGARPAHQVTLTQGFYMGVHTVTQGLWEAVMGSNPSSGNRGELHPVTDVSWFDAVRFANELSIGMNLMPAYTISGNNVTWNREANGYRLPTEAEWEFATRAGTTTAWSFGDVANNAYMWTSANSQGGTQEVGTRLANPWGLYDMHGNVWEWVWDWFGNYPGGARTDPTGAVSGSSRVLRGGSWSGGAEFARSAARSSFSPGGRWDDGGFRLVRP